MPNSYYHLCFYLLILMLYLITFILFYFYLLLCYFCLFQLFMSLFFFICVSSSSITFFSILPFSYFLFLSFFCFFCFCPPTQLHLFVSPHVSNRAAAALSIVSFNRNSMSKFFYHPILQKNSFFFSSNSRL